MIKHPQLKAYQLKLPIRKNVDIIKVQLLQGLIHHWKGHDLETVDYDYHQGPTPSAETKPSQNLRTLNM